MNSIIKPNNYNPSISSNTVLNSNKSSLVKSNYLKVDNTLSEFSTDEQKFYARKNLGVFSKEEINLIILLLLLKDNDLDERLKKFEIWYTEENNY